jgi:hypothetical protein
VTGTPGSRRRASITGVPLREAAQGVPHVQRLPGARHLVAGQDDLVELAGADRGDAAGHHVGPVVGGDGAV